MQDPWQIIIEENKMKEIKAYVRPKKAEEIITELEVNGLTAMTVIDVSMIGSWADPDKSKLSMEYCEKYCNCVKIEFVCPDEDVDKYLNLILNKGHSGQKGDGKIFISDISDAYSITTKKHGAEALEA
jgi:nitrogen regulatory protein P-II 1